MTAPARDDRLLEAPTLYRTPATRPSDAEAQAWCRALATSHYENFHVASVLLPRGLRPHFHSIYAFCRTSDDLGDEVADTATATRLLAAWRTMLQECFATPAASRHPVFVALQPTISACNLPLQPFADLISAFEQDQVVTHHTSLETLEAYSRLSANPVGRLVLLASGYPADAELFALSDDICTGLQLANFYQDIVEDCERGRRYIPADAMQRFGVTDEQLIARRFDDNVRSMMTFLVADARARLTRGSRIVTLVDRDLAATLSLFVAGGNAILDAIAAQGYDTLRHRPVVTRAAKAKLLLRAVTGKLQAAFLPPRAKPDGTTGGPSSAALSQRVGYRATAREDRTATRKSLATQSAAIQSAAIQSAYAVCRAIAKREAKNFYYAFRVLPRRKSDAMCAVYAFMRRADDLADDESLTLEARREAMAAWTAAWHGTSAACTADPVFLAVRDTQQRFAIPDTLFDQLLAGTTMDLDPCPQGVTSLALDGRTFQAQETFAALYRYCYLVASVVGLVCIRIFQYTDARAELLAEHTGIAFQLTNILRDIREDADRGRLYLPLDDIAGANTAPEAILAASAGSPPAPALLLLLQTEIARARAYYRAAEDLIPLLAPDSRPAMRVLVEIYRRLLERIAADPAAVFRERISVPTSEKLIILTVGMASSLRARIFRGRDPR